MQVWTVRCRDL